MPLGGCGLAPQNEFEGSTPLVASACWDRGCGRWVPKCPLPLHVMGSLGECTQVPCPVSVPADRDVGA